MKYKRFVGVRSYHSEDGYSNVSIQMGQVLSDGVLKDVVSFTTEVPSSDKGHEYTQPPASINMDSDDVDRFAKAWLTHRMDMQSNRSDYEEGYQLLNILSDYHHDISESDYIPFSSACRSLLL